MSANGGSNTTSSVPSEAPVVRVRWQRQLLEKKIFIPFLLLAVLIVATVLAVIKASKPTSFKQPQFNIKTDYKNPFKQTQNQYVNPFKDLK